jgi:branched-chain amino acid transport system substrate-binding protein
MPWAIENVGQNYAILAEDYAFGQQTAGGFQAQIEAFGGSVVPNGAPIFAPTGTTDFTPYIQQILDSEPDGLVLVWADNTSATLLFEQLDSQGVTGQIPFITGFSSNDLTALLDAGFIGSTGLIVYHYSLPDTEANDWLVEQHLEQYDGRTRPVHRVRLRDRPGRVVEGLLATEGDTSTDAMIPRWRA